MPLSLTSKSFRRSHWSYVLAALALAAYAWVNWIGPLSGPLRKTILDLFPVGPQLTAMVLCWRIFSTRRAQNPRIGAGWLWTGIAAAVSAPAGIFWAYYEWVLRREPVSPHLADFVYIAAYPLELIGVILLFRTTTTSGRARILLDCAIVTSAVAIAIWLLIGGGLWRQSELNLLGKILTTSQPLLDVAVLFGVLILTSTRTSDRYEQRGRLLLAGSLAIWSLGDILYTRDTLNGTYITGVWYEITWTLSPICLCLGAVQALSGARSAAPVVDTERADAQTRSLALLLPSALLITAATAVVLDQAKRIGEATGPIAAMAIPVGLAVIRQVIQLIAEGDSSAKLRAEGRHLQEAVALRSQELNALHELIGEINRSLEEEDVWRVALNRTRQAFGALAAAVWLPSSDARLGQPHDDESENQRLHLWRAEGEPLASARIAELELATAETAQVQEIPVSATRGPAVFLSAPIVWRDRNFGALGVVVPSPPPATAARLITDIGRAIGPAVANARTFAEVRDEADRDPVTGLLNHRAIHRRMRESLQAAADTGAPVTVVILDIDNFKLFNDTNGHLAGDAVLRNVARLLRDVCPADTALSRYGGDEFCAVVPGIGGDAADRLQQRLTERLRSSDTVTGQGSQRIPLSASVGVAVFPRDGLQVHELVGMADRKMYRAKNRSAPRRAGARLAHDSNLSETLAPLEAMVSAIDNKDQYTRAHSEDVTVFTSWMADALGVGRNATQSLRIAAMLHDIGKIGVPDEILRKPGPLTADEFEAMKRHAALGALIVGAMPGMADVVPAIRGHHERWDGKGYPDNLKGKDIPHHARILAVADAFSAMTTDRPYRKAMRWDEALANLESHAGTQFDPELVRLFLQVAPQYLDDLQAQAA